MLRPRNSLRSLRSLWFIPIKVKTAKNAESTKVLVSYEGLGPQKTRKNTEGIFCSVALSVFFCVFRGQKSGPLLSSVAAAPVHAIRGSKWMNRGFHGFHAFQRAAFNLFRRSSPAPSARLFTR